MTRRRHRGAWLLLLAGAGCAIQAPPPGGPPDQTPPVLVAILPDSTVEQPGFDGNVVFQFNEVVSEGGQSNFGLGTGDLEKQIILSPSPSVPRVQWKRRSIQVRPKEGWRPNTTYRVQLLPGISDVRNNRGTAAAILTFRTGGPAPDYTLTGDLYDWTTGNALVGALVEAVPAGDTTGYRALGDSSGSFTLGPLPRGEYLVYAVVDQNRNNRRDPREAFDSLRVSNDSGMVGELWTFPHDSVPARVTRIDPVDTTGGTITLSLALDPSQMLDTTMIRVRQLPDSVPVAVTALLFGTQADSVRQAQAAARSAARDSAARAAAPADSLARPSDAELAAKQAGARVPTSARQGRKGSRTPLQSKLVFLLALPAKPDDRFLIDLTGIRTVSGVSSTARGVLVIPARKEPLPSSVPDSVRRDSTETRDSVP